MKFPQILSNFIWILHFEFGWFYFWHRSLLLQIVPFISSIVYFSFESHLFQFGFYAFQLFSHILHLLCTQIHTQQALNGLNHSVSNIHSIHTFASYTSLTHMCSCRSLPTIKTVHITTMFWQKKNWHVNVFEWNVKWLLKSASVEFSMTTGKMDGIRQMESIQMSKISTIFFFYFIRSLNSKSNNFSIT